MQAHTSARATAIISVAAVLTMIIVGVVLIRTAAAAAPVQTTLEFDVSEDGTRFVFDDAPLFDDGFPAYGNGFVTQGWIYEDGTLGDHDGVVVDDDGNAHPEFPDEVIGTWTCYGYFIGDGAHETEDAWVVTTQLYDFEDGSSFVSVGTELPQGAGTITRAITGGTGDYALAHGEISQAINGHNGTDGVNVDYTATITTGVADES